MEYNHKKIEKKWQEFWLKKNTFFTDLNNSSKKKYILSMFPYPSGNGLHVGHIRNYTISDCLARFYRLNGYNVLMPIGWDSFGLPAEQYAIKTGNHPSNFTKINIERFKQQLLKMGFSYDWNKEIDTSDYKYYAITQWIFKKIYLKDLAKYEKTKVYWCEDLGTVLSNEEIETIKGFKFSKRGSYPVVEKSIFQWILKITKYSEKLLDDLDDLDWPINIKNLQRNWIGLSKGTLVYFSIENNEKKIEVFTTNPQSIYGVCAISISINHPLIKEFNFKNSKKMHSFCEEWNLQKNYTNKEIEGLFTGNYCINPINNQKVPIWIVNFIVSDYGSGAVMISPLNIKIKDSIANNLINDKEINQNISIDLKFCQKYNIKTKDTIESFDKKKWFYINSELINGIFEKEKAKEIINLELENKKKGRILNNYHLRDWIFSRQRYWGEPIPIIHLNNGKRKILSDKELPLKLPHLDDFSPSKLYYSPLQKIEKWNTLKEGKRDVNVMPQWAGSCWYYIAFLLKNKSSYLKINEKKAKEIIKKWLPVDIYVGGQEHANLHLLYSRFWHKILYETGIVFQKEPFEKLICQGMILGEDGEKMSKSKGNVISPDSLIENFGADSLRLSIIFLSPIEQTTNFYKNGVFAMRKWIEKIYKFSISYYSKDISNYDFSEELKEGYLEMIQKITISYEKTKLNLVISYLMTFFNICKKNINKKIPVEYFLDFLKLLNPIAPHISEEIWNFLKKDEFLSSSNWPKIKLTKNQYLKKINIVVQLNGKKYCLINTDLDKEQLEIENILKNEKSFRIKIKNIKIKKIIFLKNKFINLIY